MPASSTHKGWRFDKANDRLDIYYGGSRLGHVDSTGLTILGTVTAGANVSNGTIDDRIEITGTLLVDGKTTVAGGLGLGAAEAVTIATGVATVTKPYVALSGEGAANDQLDTVTWTGVAEGDLLILTRAANTITVDDANIDLGAATRNLSATGHYLGLIYDGAGWGELFFVNGDNV